MPLSKRRHGKPEAAVLRLSHGAVFLSGQSHGPASCYSLHASSTTLNVGNPYAPANSPGRCIGCAACLLRDRTIESKQYGIRCVARAAGSRVVVDSDGQYRARSDTSRQFDTHRSRRFYRHQVRRPDLAHPRWLYTLPNGDILVAESDAPNEHDEGSGLFGWIRKQVMKRAGAGVPSPDRIVLLRDVDGGGTATMQTVFLRGLHSPFGMALIGNQLYVADTDALLRFNYTPRAPLRSQAPASRLSTCQRTHQPSLDQEHPGRSVWPTSVHSVDRTVTQGKMG